ncbi:MAG: hypothetical protein WCL16_00855 [bacterium]
MTLVIGVVADSHTGEDDAAAIVKLMGYEPLSCSAAPAASPESMQAGVSTVIT